MFHLLQKKMVKKIRNKGTINVLQGGGVSGVWSKTIKRPFFFWGPFLSALLSKTYTIDDPIWHTVMYKCILCWSEPHWHSFK